jgi:hypothetical protein
MGGKTRRKKETIRTRRRWADNIKLEFRGTGWGVMDWTD